MALRPSSIVLMGATATGKTRLAVGLARALGAAVASVDSRQVYRGLDLCSGKDLAEYGSGNEAITVQGLDLLELKEEFSLFAFAHHAQRWSLQAEEEGRRLVWCGGSSLYLDALLKGYDLREAPLRQDLREEAEHLDTQELVQRLRHLNPRLHNRTDLEDRERLLRALEIALAGRSEHQDPVGEWPGGQALLLVLELPPEELRRRIVLRLRQRLAEGLVEEVAGLLQSGVPAERLHRLGLEARWVMMHLEGQLSLDQMEEGLAREIWHFARSQRSWLRRFQRQGLTLHTVDALGDALSQALARVEEHDGRP